MTIKSNTTHRGFVYRLYPDYTQKLQLQNFANVCRAVYNIGLEQRRDFHRQFKRQNGVNISFITQSRELTELRSKFEWIKAVTQTAEQNALKDLDSAFRLFFQGKARYPSFRNKQAHNSFRFKGRECIVRKQNASWSTVYIPKIGWIKFRNTRPMEGRVISATVSFRAGWWSISFCCAVIVKETHSTESVGVDRGVSVPLALSNGEKITLPASLSDLNRRHKSAQRIAARKTHGSKRHQKAIDRARKIKAKQARVRKHWAHEATTAITRQYGTVVIEDLNTAGMTRRAKGVGASAKSGLNRSILNVGWHQIEQMLAYKAGTLIKVNPAYTSQTCSACGVTDKKSRKSQALFDCRSCDHRENADLNAAKNILNRGNTPSIEGSMCGPADVRTIELHYHV